MTSLKIIAPTILFVMVIILFMVAPSAYIKFTNYVPVQDIHPRIVFEDATHLYFITLLIFIGCFLLTRIALSNFAGIYIARKWIVDTIEIGYAKRLNRYVTYVGTFSVISLLVYAVNGGADKLFQLGEDIGGREYRFMNFDDIPRIYTALLQIVRRVLLPLTIVYVYLLRRIKVGSGLGVFLFLFALQLIASSFTMARAPFLTLFAGILYVILITNKSKIFLMLISATAYVTLVLIAGVLTNLQYNITTFTLDDVFAMGVDFTINRMWLVPSVVPINLSFVEFGLDADSLYLKYSRLLGLFTGNVVGTEFEDSIYVAPVGIIGDVWRNFGMPGIVVIGAFLGGYFSLLDNLFKKTSFLGATMSGFLLVALVFYWVMGVFFSQGAFFIMILCPLLMLFDIYGLRKYKRKVSFSAKSTRI